MSQCTCNGKCDDQHLITISKFYKAASGDEFLHIAVTKQGATCTFVAKVPDGTVSRIEQAIQNVDKIIASSENGNPMEVV